MKPSKNFTTNNFHIREFLRSDIAESRGQDGKMKYPEMYKAQQNPSEEVLLNLEALIIEIMQPLRVLMGSAIYISSGYRCLELNRKVGSKDTSQHIVGEACDFSLDSNWKTKEAYNEIRKGFNFHQVIYYPQRNFVHVSFKRHGRNKKQALVFFEGHYICLLYTSDAADE